MHPCARRTLARTIVALLILLTTTPAPGQTATPAPDDAKLVAALESYFKADTDKARRDALSQVAQASSNAFADVSAALPKLKLWEPRPAGIDRVEIKAARGRRDLTAPTVIHVRVPEGYDPHQAYPLLLGFADHGRDAAQFADFLAALAGERSAHLIIASVEGLTGHWFSDPPEAAGDPANLLALLKRRYHLDTNRVLLAGYGAGGYAAFSLALTAPDAFAAVMPLAGACGLETGAESADLFLPNLSCVPVLAVFGADDVEEHHPAPGETVLGGVAAWNRYMAAQARRLNVPLEIFELPQAAKDGIVPDAATLARFLDAQRPVAPASVALRFRYPEQGKIAWLRQTRFTGDPWTAQQIVISPAANEKPEDAVRAVLGEKLAYLAGRIEGQAIHIETGRCDRIDVLLSEALLDLDQDITIHLDGTQRFTGKVERKLATLLEEARRDWEFKRPVAARLQISKSGRAIEY